ncbi:hemolysin [Photobacterium kishitanii]|uniref:DUF333 domain-containing protein n=1 Tax=Photobacterium kishitanii TaxID=318456 RepID=A0AAX0YZX7_9GAMM|nr:DUF333 domain-containing protein [Photobacterium kishitanii]KJG11753.1 hemolysin [Photobacterium kishitanii]KJG58933.1 hemolysin [Photobacterium kishitanii]KJG62137.1 hemolysin [Photobacterium kishitanii]KJG67133.1 hemolysin [Photobacterium kishitanii]KJG70622.1 hemolysin [Photobacterium kishitanii]
MKKQLVVTTLVVSSLTLIGCSQDEKPISESVSKANPASVYCADQGGKVVMKQEEKGTVGYCHLSNGKVVEEWILYRENNK